MHIYRATAAIVAHSLAGVCKVNSFANHTTRDATLTYQTLNYFDQDEVAFLPRQLRAPRFSRMSQYPSRLNVQCCTLCAFTIRVWMSSAVHCVPSQFAFECPVLYTVCLHNSQPHDPSSCLLTRRRAVVPTVHRLRTQVLYHSRHIYLKNHITDSEFRFTLYQRPSSFKHSVNSHLPIS